MTSSRVLGVAVLVYLALVAVFVAREFHAAGQIGPPIDDGWIYMAFARSLAMGEGVTYPGHDGPVCSVTGPIWNALLALGFVLGGSSVVVAKACGVVTGLVAIFGANRLGTVATGGDRRVGALAALLLASSPRFVWGSLSIMEVPFFVATVSFGIAMHLERRRAGLARWLPALFVLQLAGWARPECFFFAVFATLDRRRVVDGVACLGLLALYPLYHLVTYGHPLPTTFYAKASGGAAWSMLAREGVGAAAMAFVVNPLHQVLAFVAYLPTYLPFLALGFLPALRRVWHERRAAAPSAAASGVVWVACALVGFALVRGLLGVASPAFQYGRYFGHTWVLFAVVALYGFDFARVGHRSAIVVMVMLAGAWLGFPRETMLYVFDWTSGEVGTTLDTQWAIFWVAAAAGVVLLLAGLLSRRPARPPLWAAIVYLVVANGFGAAHHGQNVRDTFAMNVAMAEHVRQIVPAGERVACHDIGALGYFADRPLLDLAGLGSPEVAFGPRRENGSVDGKRALIESRVRWLCVTEGMFDAIMGGTQSLPELRSAIPRHTIEEPRNVTLLGSKYHLIELEWR